MSYDLYFTSPTIPRDHFHAYFSERSRYEVGDNQVWYSNEDTGVYFSFDYHDAPQDGEDDVPHSVMFNMNFYRPHYFVFEAEPEVSQFVERFGCAIHDPQNSGMGESTYSPEGFIRGWNHGNEFGYRAVLSGEKPPETVHTRPTTYLEDLWRWNLQRAPRTASLKKDIFIPRIMFVLIDRQLYSACVWPDAISTVIPTVERLIIPRDSLAPRSLFTGRKKDTCVIPFETARHVLQEYTVAGYEFPAFELPCPDTPRTLKEFVRGLDPIRGQMTGVSMDQVLNRELVEKYERGQPAHPAEPSQSSGR